MDRAISGRVDFLPVPQPAHKSPSSSDLPSDNDSRKDKTKAKKDKQVKDKNSGKVQKSNSSSSAGSPAGSTDTTISENVPQSRQSVKPADSSASLVSEYSLSTTIASSSFSPGSGPASYGAGSGSSATSADDTSWSEIPLHHIATEKQWEALVGTQLLGRDKQERRSRHCTVRLSGPALVMKEVAKQMKHNIFEVLSLENVTIDSDGFAKLLEALRSMSKLRRFQLGPATEPILVKKIDSKTLTNIINHPYLTEIVLRSLKIEPAEAWLRILDPKAVGSPTHSPQPSPSPPETPAANNPQLIQAGSSNSLSLHSTSINSSASFASAQSGSSLSLSSLSPSSSVSSVASIGGSLQSLDLSNNALPREAHAAVIAILQKSEYLSSLNLSDTHLQEDSATELFNAVASCRMLRVLKIAHNNRIGVNALRSLSLALEKPSCNLLHLDISGCQLWNRGLIAMARGLAQNLSLMSLNIAYNEISSCEGLLLEAHPSIRHLILRGNKLNDAFAFELLRFLEHNRSLESIDVCENKFTEVGRAFLSQLARRSISLQSIFTTDEQKQQLFSSPDPLSRAALQRNRNWSNLETCTESSHLFPIPAAIPPGVVSSNHAKLKSLSSPSEPIVAALLVSLSFSSNEAETAIGKLKGAESLQILSLYDNKLTAIPNRLLNLKSLTELDLSRNGITTVPPTLSSVQSLKRLDLRWNKISDLANSALSNFSFRELIKLNLSHNELTSLPVSVVRGHPSLTDLQVWNNSKMPQHLSWLYFHFRSNDLALIECNLSTLPDEIPLLLTHLFNLDLSRNRIRMLPSSISILDSLVKLDLSSNLLDTLPYQLGLLSRLKILSLSGNPLTSLPEELHRGTNSAKDICAFVQMYDQGADMLLQARVMLLGEDNESNDESFVNCLRKEMKNVIPAKNSPITLDISATSTPLSANFVTRSTHEIILNGTQKLPVTFHLWNFLGSGGGADTSHAMFTARRSMSMLVFRLNEDFAVSKRRIDTCLQNVYNGGGASGIFLVGTNLGHARCSKEYLAQMHQHIEQLYLNGKYHTIRGFFTVGGKNHMQGYEALVKSLFETTAQQKWLIEQIPKSMIDVGTDLLQKRRELSPPVMPLAQLSDLLQKRKVPESARSVLVQMLYLYGVIAEEKTGTGGLILDPFWLFNAYHSLTKSAEAISGGGVISSQTIHSQSWSKIPAALHQPLLYTFERMELLISSQSEKYVIVGALSESDPPKDHLAKMGWVRTKDLLIGRVFSFECVPSGLFSRLLTRAFHTARVLVFWRHGMLLRYDSQSAANVNSKEPPAPTSALVEAAIQQIRIYIRGPDAGFLLATLVSAINNLLQHFYPDLEAEVKSICTCSGCSSSSRIYLYSNTDCESVAAEMFAGRTRISDEKLRTDPSSMSVRSSSSPNVLSSMSGGMLVCGFSGARVPLVEVAPDVALADLRGSLINFNLLDLQEELGASAYATISRGKYGEMDVAVKQLRTDNAILNENAFSELRAEAWIMKRLAHPSIIKLIGICKDPMALVMEFAPRGNLASYLLKSHPLPQKFRLRIAVNVADALTYLHAFKPPILHRDIKSHNVLLVSTDDTQPTVAKIADFGTCVTASSYLGRAVDNPLWLAPETMSNQPTTDKSDVYSLAMVMYELLTGKLPFAEYDFPFTAKLEAAIVNGLRPNLPSDTFPSLAKLIKQMWAQKPADRPTSAAAAAAIRAAWKEMQAAAGGNSPAPPPK